MLPNVLEQIALADLQRLVDDKVQEGKSIEYKGGMYQLDSDKQDVRLGQHEEFFKDVSSFANTSGGDLLIGVKAKDGIAERVVGVEAADPDSLKMRLAQLLETGVEPRFGSAIHFIQVADNKYVFVIRTP